MTHYFDQYGLHFRGIIIDIVNEDDKHNIGSKSITILTNTYDELEVVSSVNLEKDMSLAVAGEGR